LDRFGGPFLWACGAQSVLENPTAIAWTYRAVLPVSDAHDLTECKRVLLSIDEKQAHQIILVEIVECRPSGRVSKVGISRRNHTVGTSQRDLPARVGFLL
jgi:hypothetical protein